MSIGASKIHDLKQIFMTLDHDVQNKSETNLKKYQQIEEFAKKQGVDFYLAGRERIDDLIENQLSADKGATYAKSLYLKLSTLSPCVSRPNSVKVATPLHDLESQNIKLNKAYLVSCTNSRASDLAAAAKIFKKASKDGVLAKIAPGVEFHIAAASIPEQEAAEDASDWQALLDAGAIPLPAGCWPCIGLGTGLLEPGEVGISASNRNLKGRMGFPDAKAYLASPEVVVASALSGKISGPGWYEKPVGVEKVVLGEGNGIVDEDRAMSVVDAPDKLIESTTSTEEAGDEQLTNVLPGFPEKVEGEIVFCDANNINTDGIYPGKYTYQDGVSVEKMAEVCMENYDKYFGSIAREGDTLVLGFNFGCGSSREQAATAILAKKIPLIVSGSFGNIFSRNSINSALMAVEVPRLVQRLREAFYSTGVENKGDVKESQLNKDSLDSPPPAAQASPAEEKVLTRRTGWKFVWDVRRSKVFVTEGEGGPTWSQKVGELLRNVQEIIARGGLEKWVKAEIGEGA
ncbi:hypothetical protein G7Y89_g4619 [Cudoniella acicularis]|uniref:Homoaconitase, mitochondrial n=1 Tax=Cudoniella acicularis TaxID=354080 RepID=A0A8H4RP29_9HELO|nr:hypothetical protein G7Y89_g4619 [Cudoniella acicularis]